MKIVVRIASSYVVNRYKVNDDYVLGDDEVQDVREDVHIGDWYESREGRFYRPIGSTPEDSPLFEGGGE